MNLKPQPNHRLYIQALRRMKPEERLRQAWELSDFSKRLMLIGLRQRFPDKTESEIHKIALQRLAKCHNRNY